MGAPLVPRLRGGGADAFFFVPGLLAGCCKKEGNPEQNQDVHFFPGLCGRLVFCLGGRGSKVRKRNKGSLKKPIPMGAAAILDMARCRVCCYCYGRCAAPPRCGWGLAWPIELRKAKAMRGPGHAPPAAWLCCATAVTTTAYPTASHAQNRSRARGNRPETRTLNMVMGIGPQTRTMQ